MKFTACEHLEFSNNYTAKKQVMGNGKIFWLRDVSHDPSLPAMVQFCSKYGRLNTPDQCCTKANAACSDYKDFEHDVSID